MSKEQKKEIIDLAKNSLNEGKSHQTVLEELVLEYKNPQLIANIIKHFPTIEAKKKYGIWNNILLFCLISFSLLFVITSKLGLSIIWLGLAIYAVVKMKIKYYIFLSVIGAFMLLAIAFLLFKDGSLNLESSIFISLSIPIIYISTKLSKSLSPKLIEKKERIVDENGKIRFKLTYRFED